MEWLAFLPIGLLVLVALLAWAVAMAAERRVDRRAAKVAVARRRVFRPVVIEGGKPVMRPEVEGTAPASRIA